DGATGDGQREGLAASPTPTIDQILSQAYTKRQQATTTDNENDSDDDEFGTTTTAATPSLGIPPPVRSQWTRRYVHRTLTIAAIDHDDTVSDTGHCG
nr:hypothetical protein [Tanacetum cinerariifolium]